jgi:hypothetical protein
MTEDERREYATALILEHARDISYLSIYEAAEEHAGVAEISDEDARAVHDLIVEASVSVSVTDGAEAPAWVAAVLPEEIVRQRAAGWPDFHPETFCHRCGRRNPCWSVDSEEWGKAVAGRDRGDLEILCPSCFVLLHEQATGGWGHWHLGRSS